MQSPGDPGSATGDTIVACATPWGRAAIAVLRLSGPGVSGVLARVCPRERGLPPPRRAVLVRIRDDQGVMDEGLLTWMPGPSSYTGEDSAELSCHGNPLLVERLLAACVVAGCRVAEPGEFTRRAHANGRLDLLRAEAVLQAIEARSPAGLEVAARGLRGELTRWSRRRREELMALAAELEARLDFPDQLEALGPAGPQLQDDASLAARIGEARAELDRVADSFRRSRVQVRGARVALVGPVNAGKSSLFNALLGRRRALVSPRPGTTRDVLEARAELRGLPVLLMDTAGENTEPEELERDGLALRDELLAEVDLLVVVLPAHRLELPEVDTLLASTRDRPRVLVGNHADRPGARFELAGRALLPCCALDASGLDELEAAIAEALVGEEPGESAAVIASQRQHELLRSSAEALGRARWALLGEAGVAVAAEELITALERLDAMGGSGVREEVLDALFDRFCIGK
jgi:tRNA modification GTPase